MPSGCARSVAARLGLVSLSDLRRHPGLKFGFSNEFMDRADGWPGLRDRYGLPQRDVRGLDHDLAYRALASEEIQATDLYSTDAEIKAYSLRVLRDDLGFFPSYECVWLYRSDLPARSPAAFAALARLEGRITAAEMAAHERSGQDRSHSRRTRSGRLRRGEVRDRGQGPLGDVSREASPPAGRASRAGVDLAGGGDRRGDPAGRRGRTSVPGWARSSCGGRDDPDHPFARAAGVHDPLARDRRQARPGRAFPVQPAADRAQHGHGPARHPELAPRIGRGPGLASAARLLRIELPLASRAILAGIKTAAVINVGTATIGALIGAGGFGQPILTGIRRDDLSMILFEGAIPAALLALAVQGAFDLAERFLVPRGLRL